MLGKGPAVERNSEISFDEKDVLIEMKECIDQCAKTAHQAEEAYEESFDEETESDSDSGRKSSNLADQVRHVSLSLSALLVLQLFCSSPFSLFLSLQHSPSNCISFITASAWL